MKIRLLLAVAGLSFGFAFPILAQERRAVDPQDRQQIEAAWMKFQEAYNKRDAAAIAALHTQDAIEVRSWVSEAGGLFSGRQAIEEMFKADFASYPGKMVNKLVQLYAIGNAICLIEDSQVGGGMVQAVVIYVRDGDAWKRRVTYVASR